jgi:hypothetical protein
LELHEQALDALGRLVFQTYRSRLYRAAALVALNRAEEGAILVREAVVGRPSLKVSDFLFRERYRDVETRQRLRRRLREAHLPS